MERRQVIFYWVLASAGLMVIGAFGPWAKVFGLGISGTDGSNDGWLVVILAVVGGGLFLWKREAAYGGIWPTAGGVLGAAVTIYDRQNLSSGGGNELADALVEVGWGLNLAMIASISLAIAGGAWLWLRLAEVRQAPPAAAAEPAASIETAGDDT